MDPLKVLLLVLVAAGVWAVVELALTIRKARSSVEEIDAAQLSADDEDALTARHAAAAHAAEIVEAANTATAALAGDGGDATYGGGEGAHPAAQSGRSHPAARRLSG